MTSTQLTILRTISTNQPILSSALFKHCNLTIRRDSFAYILQTLIKQGLVNGGDGKPVWLTLRGKEVIESEVE